jgi:hypothetical protein
VSSMASSNDVSYPCQLDTHPYLDWELDYLFKKHMYLMIRMNLQKDEKPETHTVESKP